MQASRSCHVIDQFDSGWCLLAEQAKLMTFDEVTLKDETALFLLLDS